MSSLRAAELKLTSHEILLLGEIRAVQDAFVLLMGAQLGNFSDDVFAEFIGAYRQCRLSDFGAVTSPAIAAKIGEAFFEATDRFADRLIGQRDMVLGRIPVPPGAREEPSM